MNYLIGLKRNVMNLIELLYMYNQSFGRKVDYSDDDDYKRMFFFDT